MPQTPSHSQPRPPASQTPPPRSAFTIVELLIAACLLVIVLGLAVSLSRHVRAQSARVLTGDLLVRMEKLLDAYTSRHGTLIVKPEFFPASTIPPTLLASAGSRSNRGEVEPPPPTSPPADPAASKSPLTPDPTDPPPSPVVTFDESALVRLAEQNNRSFLKAVSSSTPPEFFAQLSISVYDPMTPSLRDAWGTPIVFIPRTHPILGMAPRDAPFFLSAGPDRKFLTLADNLYSYEAFPRAD